MASLTLKNGKIPRNSRRKNGRCLKFLKSLTGGTHQGVFVYLVQGLLSGIPISM